MIVIPIWPNILLQQLNPSMVTSREANLLKECIAPLYLEKFLHKNITEETMEPNYFAS